MFYGRDQAAIHHARFGALAQDAAHVALGELSERSKIGAAGASPATVVDLGCGSGIFARAMTDAGYDVVGVDLSADMVALARDHAPAGRFAVGSVHDFAVPTGAAAVAALGEVLNYATDARAGLDAIAALARRVRAALAPGGLFLFDVSTPGRGGPGGHTERFHVDKRWALGMHAIEHDDMLERAITIFVRGEDATYRRVDEHHVLHLYEVDAVVDNLERAGFEVHVRDGYGAPAPFPGWKVFIAR